MKKRVIRLTESDIEKMVNRIIKEHSTEDQEIAEEIFSMILQLHHDRLEREIMDSSAEMGDNVSNEEIAYHALDGIFFMLGDRHSHFDEELFDDAVRLKPILSKMLLDEFGNLEGIWWRNE
jgi:hypothetical protein